MRKLHRRQVGSEEGFFLKIEDKAIKCNRLQKLFCYFTRNRCARAEKPPTID